MANFSSANLIELWEDLVNECENGYPSSCYELDYDLSVRDELQSFAQQLNNDELFNRLEKIDNRFRDISTPLQTPEASLKWWRNRILKYGSSEYANSVEKEHKIAVQIK